MSANKKYEAVILTKDGNEFIDPVLALSVENPYNTYSYTPEEVLSITIREIKEDE